ncbi:MAG: glutamine-hydrolyzing carbamoyl-phosphate synthase small subunit [Candidatus Geothermincolia bacterium]
MKKAIVLLEDGKYFEGISCGALGERVGEIVFNTSMGGYQEIVTDSSYKGQIVTMTYPQIGNYGVNLEDLESCGPQVEGLVVRECCPYPSNWRSVQALSDYLSEHGIVGVEDIDTRAVTLHIRSLGAMKCIISSEDTDLKSLKERLDAAPGIIGVDLVAGVSCRESYVWERAPRTMAQGLLPEVPVAHPPLHVVAIDCGIKRNILHILQELGCRITVVPADSSADYIMGLEPDGVFISNGPGDPAAVTYTIETVRDLLGKRPIFGICLGHQILGLAMGGSTYKLKFGHRGANQPVRDLRKDMILITSQNHGFAVDIDTIADQVDETFTNLNDNTSEGMRHKRFPAYSVQFHPEHSPGPHDAVYLFADFVHDMLRSRGEASA